MIVRDVSIPAFNNRYVMWTETLDLNYILGQINQTDIHRLLHPTAQDDRAYAENCPKECLLGYKTGFSTHKKIEVESIFFPDNN